MKLIVVLTMSKEEAFKLIGTKSLLSWISITLLLFRVRHITIDKKIGEE